MRTVGSYDYEYDSDAVDCFGYITNVVARPGGGVIVPDYERHSMKEFDMRGDFVRYFGKPGESFLQDPTAAAIVDSDTAWVIVKTFGRHAGPAARPSAHSRPPASKRLSCVVRTFRFPSSGMR